MPEAALASLPYFTHIAALRLKHSNDVTYKVILEHLIPSNNNIVPAYGINLSKSLIPLQANYELRLSSI